MTFFPRGSLRTMRFRRGVWLSIYTQVGPYSGLASGFQISSSIPPIRENRPEPKVHTEIELAWKQKIDHSSFGKRSEGVTQFAPQLNLKHSHFLFMKHQKVTRPLYPSVHCGLLLILRKNEMSQMLLAV